jgi:hypothetical protein
MASIAVQMAEHAIEGRDDKHEKAMFAVCQVSVMLKKLKKDYDAAWHGERRPTWSAGADRTGSATASAW